MVVSSRKALVAGVGGGSPVADVDLDAGLGRPCAELEIDGADPVPQASSAAHGHPIWSSPSVSPWAIWPTGDLSSRAVLHTVTKPAPAGCPGQP